MTVHASWPPLCDTVELSGLPDDLDEGDVEVILLSSRYGGLSNVTKVSKLSNGNFKVQVPSEKGGYIFKLIFFTINLNGTSIFIYSFDYN